MSNICEISDTYDTWTSLPLGHSGRGLLSEQAFQETHRVQLQAQVDRTEPAAPDASVLANSAAQVHAETEGSYKRDTQRHRRERRLSASQVRKEEQQAERLQGVRQQECQR